MNPHRKRVLAVLATVVVVGLALGAAGVVLRESNRASQARQATSDRLSLPHASDPPQHRAVSSAPPIAIDASTGSPPIADEAAAAPVDEITSARDLAIAAGRALEEGDARTLAARCQAVRRWLHDNSAPTIEAELTQLSAEELAWLGRVLHWSVDMDTGIRRLDLNCLSALPASAREFFLALARGDAGESARDSSLYFFMHCVDCPDHVYDSAILRLEHPSGSQDRLLEAITMLGSVDMIRALSPSQRPIGEDVLLLYARGMVSDVSPDVRHAAMQVLARRESPRIRGMLLDLALSDAAEERAMGIDALAMYYGNRPDAFPLAHDPAGDAETTRGLSSVYSMLDAQGRLAAARCAAGLTSPELAVAALNVLAAAEESPSRRELLLNVGTALERGGSRSEAGALLLESWR